MSLDTSIESFSSFYSRSSSLPENSSEEIGTFFFLYCIITYTIAQWCYFGHFINLIFLSLNVINAYLECSTNMIYITLFLISNVYYYRQPGFNQSVLETLLDLSLGHGISQEYTTSLFGIMLGGAGFNWDSLQLIH